jgi:ABC-2 type transport system ATP-binding protein
MVAIEVDRLVKRYRKAAVNAVDDVSFEVPEGSLFCLLGPNGAGKTTTVSVLTTTLRPTSGRVRVAGRDLVTEQTQVRRAIGIVFQQPSLDLNLTAEENIRLHAILYGRHPWRPTHRTMPAAYRREVAELAELLGIADVLGRPARTLSGGMRRKLEIVRALLHRPRVLFLDEPTAGLDPESRRDLWSYLDQARIRYGTTVFLTTHYLEEAESADALCVVARGRIVERGTPAQLKARHTKPELVLDAAERGALHRELVSLGLPVTGTGPLRVPLTEPVAHRAQCVIRELASPLTRCQVVQPTLEDTYLSLLEKVSDER